MKFLAMRIHGPMQAWGEVATGEARPTRDAPTKSGVLGLVACALGIERNAPVQRQLADGYGLAVRTDRAGVLAEDYHTVGLAEYGSRDRWVKTRADEVAHEKFATKYLTRRGYIADGVFTALLWARDGAPFSLAEIADALEKPRWPLYLGRRSCPSSPLSPRMVEADTLSGALRYCVPLVGIPTVEGVLCPVQWDADPEINAVGIEGARAVRVRDSSINRRRWMFSERDVMMGRL